MYGGEQLVAIYRRLFPFGRGLCHAYWAPNIWPFYNVADKLMHAALTRLRPNASAAAPVGWMTGGLVQQFEHLALPTVRPAHCFAATLLLMLVRTIAILCICTAVTVLAF